MHLVGTLLILAFVALVVIPVGAMSALVLGPVAPPKAITTAIVMGVAFLAFAVFSNTPAAALAAPLARFGVPSVPLTALERRDGCANLFLLAFLVVVPYTVLISLLLSLAG